jgi:thioredoxin 1
MKLMKGLLSVFAIVLATTACAGNSGENKKNNESTKEDSKMEVVALNKADFLKKVIMKPVPKIGNLKAAVLPS